MKRFALALMCVLVAASLAAQQPAQKPAKTMSGSLGMYVFPAKDQSAETQQKDETTCYAWAKDNTGFDPIAASSARTQANEQQPPKGAALNGAGRGAAMGATIGAIAGDAGEGATAGAAGGAIRGRIGARKAEQRSKQAEAQARQKQAAGMDGFRKAFGACMEGKGYTVK